MLQTKLIDTVVVNGRLYTMEAPGRTIEALAIAGGRIVATGSTKEICALAGADVAIIDCEGRTGLPGLIDSHCHPDMTGARLGRWHDFSDGAVTTREQVLRLIRENLAGKPQDYWFAGYRFDDILHGGYPTRAELDEAAAGRPVLIYRRCAQMGMANTAALHAVGFTAAQADPPFGTIERSATDGEPTGLLRARAAHIVIEHIQADYTKEDFRAGLGRVLDEYLSFGITSIHNSLTQTQAIRAYQDMRDAGELHLRVGFLVTGRDEDLVRATLRAGYRSGFGDEWLKLIGVEWVGDGSTSGRTAAYHTPYVGTPLKDEPPGYCGTLLLDPDQHRARVREALDLGMIVCTDAMGDRAIAEVIRIYEDVLSEGACTDHRLRIEHCCAVTPENLEGLRRNGIICSSAAGFAWDLGDAHLANRGAGAMADFWPHRAMIDAGVIAPAHSDAPVCTANPFAAMSALVNRRTSSGASLDRRQSIEVYEAVEAYTTLGAYAGREEHLKGQLRPGMLADLCLLDRDPFATDPETLHEVRVEKAIVGGAVKFSRG
ncbi:amidohydrolase [Halodurantibacterium flavum]|uniref:Amidohydrolase n=1 Tax=Halodurantibacterium flavum TaxID=1382802 RepID=A0ABW4S227_9RHOB